MAEAADCGGDPFLQNMTVKPARQVKIERDERTGGRDKRRRGFNRLRAVVVEPGYGKNLLQGSGLLCPNYEDWQEFGEEVDELSAGYDYEWVLTAGHCVCVKHRNDVRWPNKLRIRIPKYEMWPSKTKELQKFKPGPFKALQTGRFEDIVYKKGEIQKYVHVYASYLKDFNSAAGYDFALIQIPVYKSSLSPNNIQVWDTNIHPTGFSIVGFPAELDKQYLPYYDRRRKEFKEFEANPRDPELVQAYYTSDTSGGQSGGPIQFINADENYSAIVGIHVTGKVVEDEEASGCMITRKIAKWVNKIQINSESFTRPGSNVKPKVRVRKIPQVVKVLQEYENHNERRAINVPICVKIISAYWGDPRDSRRGTDVTSNVSAGGCYVPTNGAWGDPAYGTGKVLRIKYSEDANIVRREAWERGEALQIPRNVEILGARYCDPNDFSKGKNVKVKPGEKVYADNSRFGDPCHGVVKKLYVCWRPRG